MRRSRDQHRVSLTSTRSGMIATTTILLLASFASPVLAFPTTFWSDHSSTSISISFDQGSTVPPSNDQMYHLNQPVRPASGPESETPSSSPSEEDGGSSLLGDDRVGIHSGRWQNPFGLFYSGWGNERDATGSGAARQQGWLSRWLSIGGEGSVTLRFGPDNSDNVTFPHRPAAFPSQLYPPFVLPLSGYLKPITWLLDSDFDIDTDTDIDVEAKPAETSPNVNPDLLVRPGSGSLSRLQTLYPPGTGLTPIQACWTSPKRKQTHKPPYTIALVERGGCDFAKKVRAAQDRGAAGVIVGDGVGRMGETDEEGRERENLITMFSPEDTYDIFIPSVFVSRASYLYIMDLFANQSTFNFDEQEGLWVEVSEGSDEGGALSSLLSFALLMPSLFLLATIAVHRIRVARQREADRAPPLLVLSLPERVWTPDIVWEKDSDTESGESSPSTPTPKSASRAGARATLSHTNSASSTRSLTAPTSSTLPIPPPPPISPAEVPTPPLEPIDVASRPSGSRNNSRIGMGHGHGVSKAGARSKTATRAGGGNKKPRTKSAVSAKKYFSKDECAICMDSFQQGEIVRILPCGHVFHKDECDEWLMKWRKLCPTCRADVTLPSQPDNPPLDGTRITPVTHLAGGGDDGTEPEREDGDDGAGIRAWITRARTALSSTRSRIFGRRGVQLPDEEEAGTERSESVAAAAAVGERTPLVARSST